MQSQMDQMKADQAPAAPAPAAGGIDDEMMSELKKLADLKSAGILTESEFTAAKAKLLGI
ncbi:MAG: SHOCT domain-containing protein [Actinobacteria bacterium]|nr:SHOCT domain-containing protein [Actinomycetota bacterium]